MPVVNMKVHTVRLSVRHKETSFLEDLNLRKMNWKVLSLLDSGLSAVFQE